MIISKPWWEKDLNSGSFVICQQVHQNIILPFLWSKLRIILQIYTCRYDTVSDFFFFGSVLLIIQLFWAQIREQNSRSMTLDSGDAIELLIKALSCSFLYIFLLHSVSVYTFTTVKTKISMEKPYSIGLLIPFCISGRSWKQYLPRA